MKKILSILLVAIMIFASFTACSSDTENEQKNDTSSNTDSTASNDTESNAPSNTDSTASNDTESNAPSNTDSTASNDTESNAPSNTDSTASNDTESNAPSNTDSTASNDTESNAPSNTDSTASNNTENTEATDTENTEANNNQTTQEAEEKYNSACALISEKKYTEAYTILKSITSYAPAQEKLKNFFYAPQKISKKTTYAEDDSTRSNMTEYIYNEMGNVIENSEDKIWTYDENGNVLSGCDLINGSQYCTYTYKDGKLYQKKTSSHSITETYTYNTDGSIESMQTQSDVGGAIYFYEYTYYTSGKIKTMKYSYYLYTYDENGRITQIEFINDNGESLINMKATYGEFGITKLILEEPSYRTANYKYSYDTNGKLISLVVKDYKEGKLYSTRTLEYTKHQLYYSENPSVQERIAQITCTNLEAAADLVM